MSFGANFLISDNSLSPNPWNTKIKVQSQSNIKCIYSHLLSELSIVQIIQHGIIGLLVTNEWKGCEKKW